MLIPHGLTASEIRVLQEFRRTQRKTMSLDEIKAIKHPVVADPVPSLLRKGFLTETDGGASVALTERADAFLAYDPKPRA